MPNVFIAQRQPHLDFTAAEEHGKVQFIMPTGTQIWSDRDVAEFTQIAREKLRDCTEQDSVVLTGDPIQMAICFSIMAEHNDGLVRVLKWDRRKGAHGGYTSVLVDVDAQPAY